MTGDVVEILESVRRVAASYGLPPNLVAPCVGVLLDGNLGAALRHEAAFVIAISLRGRGASRATADSVVNAWARRVDLRTRDAQRAVASAYSKNGNGEYRYHPPGLIKRPRTIYGRILAPICTEVGCPANCPPFRHLHVGTRSEGAERFIQLHWPAWLRERRWRACCDVYFALCRLERLRGLPGGAPLRTSYRQLGDIAEVNTRTVGRELYRLEALALIYWEPGRGSGPYAHDRVGSLVRRIIPIPKPRAAGSPSVKAAIRTEDGTPS